jgi:hypothetical protein
LPTDTLLMGYDALASFPNLTSFKAVVCVTSRSFHLSKSLRFSLGPQVKAQVNGKFQNTWSFGYRNFSSPAQSGDAIEGTSRASST